MKVRWKWRARWKDFFHFTRSERLGTMLLLSILLIVIALPYVLPCLITPKPTLDSNFRQEVDSFIASLKETEKPQRISPSKGYERKSREQTAEAKRFSFDPNTLDSVGFVSLGLKPFQAKNILKYRAKGGKYRKAEDFAKVYGLSPQLFAELKPYIQIQAVGEEKRSESAPETPKEEAREVLLVELNAADTTALLALRGIRSASARRIVNYRNRLGGFVRKEQLLEVMYPENYERVVPHITIDTSLVVKIDVNRASVERLMNHPYIGKFTVAQAICDKRDETLRKKKRLTSPDDLQNLPNLSAETLQKIAPYLEFK